MVTKEILDVTCGNRGIWFNKNEPHTLYCDNRREHHEGYFGNKQPQNHNVLDINPNILCDFTNLPFDDNTFSLVVFDPPHKINVCEGSWMRKEYGSLDGDGKTSWRCRNDQP